MFQNPRGNNIFIGSDVDVWELGYVKKDVYDFGILLLELIIGNESIEIKKKIANNSNGSLVDQTAHLLTSPFDLYNVIDESLIGRGFEDEIFELLRIAYTCLKLFPSQRPTMLKLYNTIRIFGERDHPTRNSKILRQSKIATGSTFGEIVEAEITQANCSMTSKVCNRFGFMNVFYNNLLLSFTSFIFYFRVICDFEKMGK